MPHSSRRLTETQGSSESRNKKEPKIEKQWGKHQHRSTRKSRGPRPALKTTHQGQWAVLVRDENLICPVLNVHVVKNKEAPKVRCALVLSRDQGGPFPVSTRPMTVCIGRARFVRVAQVSNAVNCWAFASMKQFRSVRSFTFAGGGGGAEDGGVWSAKTVKRPPQQPAQPQSASYWAPLAHKPPIMPHPAQPQHTNHWAPRTPAGEPAAAADRKQRPNATCEGKNG